MRSDRDLAPQLHRRLARRFLAAMMVPVPVAVLATSACTARVFTDGSGSGGNAGGAGGASTTSGFGGFGDTGTFATGTFASTGSFGGNTAVTSTSAGGTVTGCFAWPQPVDAGAGDAGDAGASDAGSLCPSREDASMYLLGHLVGCGPANVVSEGVLENGTCCYQTIPQFCGTGRAYLVAGTPRAAATAREPTQGWTADGDATRPCVADLSEATRARLAEAWSRDGLFEHASVASFGRFALELLAVGAPADLVAAAHEAALDEVRHATLCLTLASEYAGRTLAPSAFPFDGSVAVSNDLAEIAARAAREGCVGETIAVVMAAEQLGRATDPAVRAALAIIAEDEARHAELAWRTVAWAIRTGGERVRAAVNEAFAEALCSQGAILDAGDVDHAMMDHGRLDAATARRATLFAIADVVRPCAAALAAETSVLEDRLESCSRSVV